MKIYAIKMKVLGIGLLFSFSMNANAMILCNWSFGWSCTLYANVTCNELGYGNNAHSNFGTVFCTCGLSAADHASNNYLYVDQNNNAVLEIDGKRSDVASDKLELYMMENLDRIKEEDFLIKLHDFKKQDNGFVSQKTIDQIADDYKAEIIKIDELPKIEATDIK